MDVPGQTQVVGRRQVPRSNLLNRLEAGGVHRVNLFSAPAGFGKTTAVKQWTEQLEGPVVWISLSSDDNDPSRLWSRIIEGMIEDAGFGVQAQVALAGETGSVRPAIERLAEGLNARSSSVFLVLDDLHLIEDRNSLASIELAIELFGSASRLILISRTLPQLPLQRYMGRGQLTQVRSADLAFDEVETASLLFENSETPLNPQLVGEIRERTGGWPAALYMTSLWLQENPDPAEVSKLLPQQEERITDYLIEEVVKALSPEVRTFLRQTSFLGWMSGDLCDYCCGLVDSHEMLEQICRTNQLVERDQNRSGWFRYHALMRDLLLEQFAREEPQSLREVRNRAINWYLEQGTPEAAAEMAIEAGEFEMLADILEANHFPIGSSGRVATIWRWGLSLPGDLLDERPLLCLVVAMAGQSLAVPVVQIRRLLARAARFRDRNEEAWTPVHEAFWRALIAASAGEGLSASMDSLQIGISAAEGIPVYQVIGSAYLSSYLEMSGRPDEAERMARQAIEDPGIESHVYALIAAVTTLALVNDAHGSSGESEKWVRNGHEVVRKFGIQDTRADATVQMTDAIIAMSSGDLARAGRSAEKAVRVEFEDPPIKARVMLVSAKVQALRGQRKQAEAALQQSDEIIAACPDVGLAIGLRDEVRALLEPSESGGNDLLEPLSDAELRILPLLERGSSRAEIANELIISVNTVKTHMRSIYRKLRASNREEAVNRARAAGLL